MFRFAAAMALLVCVSSLASAQDFAQLENTYHVEVRVEHWRIGNPHWSTEFSTTNYEQAVLMHDLFEIALEEQSLRELLGFSWEWLVTDVRLRTEYPAQMTAPLIQSRPTTLLRRVYGYQTPSYGYLD
ncbi:hypothetical protein [Stieleria varia]|uniref:Uncharacterized protein n=1 Tax=Stieleria varia TaxID=2528005 RepID=A0A5C6A4Y5_9BACT|nr:hypothetical protein [Stieleria varia]TWT94430.1 hypothetical protein Pla52n_52510 [Stieleria varia]